MRKLKRNSAIFLIVLIGLLLRFIGSFTHSYSNDELSAIARLRFNNFSDFFEYGVMKGDMHPAGVQVFMKIWSAIGGVNEVWMRLPFVLCGGLSIWMVFLLGKRLFNKNAGLIAAGLLAVLYFPVLNGEFARPYSPGLLFTICVAYYLIKVLFDKEAKVKSAVLLGVFFALSMYTHYFAFLTVGFMGLTGLMFITKNNWKPYLGAGLLAVLLFLPHVGITYYHLSVGGLAWLGPPAADWLAQYFFFAFNSSWLVVALIILLVVVGLLTKSSAFVDAHKKGLLICILWFFGVYGLGHLLSLISTPLLKFPVMLFVFPFLLMLIAVVIQRIPYQKVVLAGLIVVSGISTFVERDFLKNRHFAIFDEPAHKLLDWQAQYGEENIFIIYNLNNPAYMNHYANQVGRTIEFDQDTIAFDGDIGIREKLALQQEAYCVIGFAARITLVQALESVKEFYPKLVDFEQYNNGAIYLFKKGNPADRINGELLSAFHPQKKNGKWSFNTEFLTDEAYLLNNENIYGPTFQFKLDELKTPKNAYLKVEVEADLNDGAQLTASFAADRDGQPLQYQGENVWQGRDLEKMLTESSEKLGYFAFQLPSFIKPSDQLKISLWNRNGKAIRIKSVRIYQLENKWN